MKTQNCNGIRSYQGTTSYTYSHQRVGNPLVCSDLHHRTCEQIEECFQTLADCKACSTTEAPIWSSWHWGYRCRSLATIKETMSGLFEYKIDVKSLHAHQEGHPLDSGVWMPRNALLATSHHDSLAFRLLVGSIGGRLQM